MNESAPLYIQTKKTKQGEERVSEEEKEEREE
jgi:hypothetical protein